MRSGSYRGFRLYRYSRPIPWVAAQWKPFKTLHATTYHELRAAIDAYLATIDDGETRQWPIPDRS